MTKALTGKYAATIPMGITWRILLWMLLTCFLTNCSSLPPSAPNRPTTQYIAAPEGQLARLATTKTLADSSLNGVRILDSGRDALYERAALIESAEKSIDAQYYIWNSDNSGRYLASRIYAAAERGVRVRLLLDDINVAGRDNILASLDSHPNIEIRIYNPFTTRGGIGQLVNFLGEFTRLNRRMHNKSFTVDGAVAIVGGRNIGDEYFDASPTLNFRDRDVVTVGPVVADVAQMFDVFWNAEVSRDMHELVDTDTAAGNFVAQSAEMVAESTKELLAIHAGLPANTDTAYTELQSSFAQMILAPVRLIYDPPPAADAMGDTTESQPTSVALAALARGTNHDIIFESAYLVLDDDTLAAIRSIRESGVQIRGLTNSLASNDVTANHAAYAKKRRKILQSGIDLYELRPDAASCLLIITNPAVCGPQHIFGLHAKTFVFDQSTVFIGSLNLNLRSRYLNSESGLIIESPQLATSIALSIEQNMLPINGWHLLLNADGDTVWISQNADQELTESYSDPQTTWLRRRKAGFIALLPLEKYL